ncbi:MAG: histidine kinase [Magnetovibrio sp.]|nr:histidine kinase [Magnetovibrio sp.]|tara:strand:+ start:595 stop:1758 length:1164 start_codon:yes stop_codon:yes gene_type:complete
MTTFAFAVSEEKNWANAAKKLAASLITKPTKEHPRELLGWLYITDDLATDFQNISKYLRDTTGVNNWIGSVGIGVCWLDGAGQSGEAFGRTAAVAMISEHPKDSYRILPRLGRSTSEIPKATRHWMMSSNPSFGVVHGDPMNEIISNLITTLTKEMENIKLEIPGFLVGGLTSSRGPHYQLADEVINDGLSGVLFTPEVNVATGLSQGYTPVGPVHRVSDCSKNLIITLNNKPALNIFKNDIGELLAQDLQSVGGFIHAAFPISGSDTGDYVVRNLIGIEPEQGWLAIGGDVNIDDQVMFVRRDPAGANEDLVRMVRDLAKRLPSPARGGLYFSCVARGQNLFEHEGAEMEIISRVFNHIPIVGFFGQGEISNNRLYGYTGVLVLFL